ncbi:peptidylprolyl isomerase [Sphingobium sufflavum]|nr:peptidylprolyl isomerase [Sphingobium sufflavum]MCE7797782.1 peptidylprolyl isomerase [Sphingobium sufflavum]
MVSNGVAVQAQSVPDEVGSNQLDIPKDVMLFGKNDPTVRKPTAIINGTVITGTDVDQRLALVVLANGGKVTDEERDRLRLQVLRNIIDETLQIQEAAANDITISQGEIEQSFARVAGNFKSTPEGFVGYLKSNGSSAASIKRQIEGELAWQRLLRRKVQPFVNVSQDEVNGLIDRMKQAKGSEEFRVGEIYLSSTPENGQRIHDNAEKIIEQIKQGGSFQAYARQYSEASTAAVGGDLGWVRPAQLPDELTATVQQMQPGQIGGPVALPGGFSIVYLIDKRRVLAADPRDATLSLKQIGINFTPGTSAAQAKATADRFASQVKAIQGCGTANAVAQKLGAEVVDNDGVKIRDLPPQLQQIMAGLQVGQATPPFGAVSDGVRVLVVCGRDDPVEGAMPTFDQVQGQIEEERVNKRARIYLRDLRRDAIIEYN